MFLQSLSNISSEFSSGILKIILVFCDANIVLVSYVNIIEVENIAMF
jgi:hypothetical protein